MLEAIKTVLAIFLAMLITGVIVIGVLVVVGLIGSLIFSCFGLFWVVLYGILMLMLAVSIMLGLWAL